MNRIKGLFISNYKLGVIEKIALSGLFIALVTILQKVIAVNYISAIPFVRISFGGCAIIILSSVVLGPWYGLLVGAASDLLGYFIFDPKTMGIFPQITAIYAVLGFLSFFVFKLVQCIRNTKLMVIIEYIILLSLALAVSLYVSLNDSLTLYSSTYILEIWQKITIPCVVVGLIILFLVVTRLFIVFFKKKKIELSISVRQISFSLFVIELLIMILFGSLMKGFAFGFNTYPVILLSQIIVGIFNIVLNTLLLPYMLMIFKRKE